MRLFNVQCNRSSQRSEFDSRWSLNFFSLILKRLRLFILLRRSCSFSCYIRSSKYDSFHIISIHVNSTIGYITNSKWPALLLPWLMDWTLRTVIAKAGVRIPAKHEIFQVLFQPLILGCLFYCEDHVHFLFVNATKGLLTLLYLKRKIHNRLTGSTRTLHMIPTRMLSTLRSKIPSTSGTWQKLKAET